jgi:acetyltransferase-like isoleucine patch superfamily enzyme
MFQFTFARYLLARLKEEYALCYRRYSFPGAERVDRRALVYKDPWCDLVLGEGTHVEAGTILYCRNEVPRPLEPNSYIRIGARSFIGHYCNLRTGGGFIEIGDNVLLAQFVSLIAVGHGLAADRPIREQPAPAAPRGIRIGHDVWIGAGVTVLPGVTVGDGAVLGAGAIVTHDVPANAIVAGNPARVLRMRE